MRKFLYGWVLCLFFCSSFFSALAQQPRLYVLPDSVSVGDRVHYSVVLPQGLKFQTLALPDSAAFGPDVDWLDTEILKTRSGADSIAFKLQYFGFTDLQIQDISIGLNDAGQISYLDVPPVLIPFKSLIAGEEEAELRPLKEIFAFALNWIPYLLLLLALLLGGWVLLRYMRRYLAKPEEQEGDEMPAFFENPLDILEKQLLSLRSDAPLLANDYKVFYTRLGDAIRNYIERVHGVPAMESTTREVIRDLDATGANPELRKQTATVLRQADLVKFARFEPGAEEVLSAMSAGERFLQIARESDTSVVNRLRKEFVEREELAAEERKKAAAAAKAEEKKMEDIA